MREVGFSFGILFDDLETQANKQGYTPGEDAGMFEKENADAEIVRRVWNEMNELADSVSQGYVSVSDLADTLRKEYGVNI